jgi:hypothetical protein
LKRIRLQRSLICDFIRLRPNTLQLTEGMKGKVNRAGARLSEDGFGFGAIPL